MRHQFIWIILVGFLLLGCESDTPQPDRRFFISKSWKLEILLVNGDPENDPDLLRFRLTINQDSTFTRVNFDGSERSGMWTLSTSGNQLILFPGEPNEERYFIIELQVRLLELQLTQTNRKTGDLEFRFVLEPVKPN